MSSARTALVLRRCLIGAGILTALVVGRMVLGLGVAFAHYSSTPDFATYVVDHPVAPETIDALLVPGDPLGVQGSWQTGAVDPRSLPEDAPQELFTRRLEVRIDHGEETMLDLELDVVLAMDPATFERAGVAIPEPRLVTHPGLRAIVSVGLMDVDDMVGPGSMARGTACVDVVLASGAGESEVRFVQLDSIPSPHLGANSIDFPLWRLVTGIASPMGSPPEEGLVHHVRCVQGLDWRKYEGGSGGPSFRDPGYSVNTDEYSYATSIKSEAKGPGGGGSSTEISLGRTYTWNGEVW